MLTREAEQAVIVAALRDNAALFRCPLSPDDFQGDDHRKIWATMLRMAHQHRPMDAVTVADEVGQDWVLAYLGGLQADFPSALDITDYSRAVAEASRCRKAHAVLERHSVAIREGHSEAIEDLRGELGALTAPESGTMDATQAVVAAIEEAEARSQRDRIARTGVGWVDDRITLDQGSLLVVAARPSMGKSALCSQIVVRSARTFPAVACHIELSTHQATMVALAQFHRMNNTALKRGHPESIDLLKRRDRERPFDMPVYFRDDVRDHQSVISAIHRAYHENGIRLAIVDHLHRMRWGEDESREMGGFTSDLAYTAKELGIAVVLASQLNRDLDKSERRPRMSDLRQCGAIEQDATDILFLYGDKNTEGGKRRAYVAIEKCRDGTVGWTEDDIWFDGPTQTFYEEARGLGVAGGDS